MEAFDHRIAEHGVGEADEGHALVMRQILPDDASRLRSHRSLRILLARRVIDGLVEAERPLGADLGQAREVGRHGPGIDRGREGAGIGCDDEIIGEATFESEPRDAERHVLVIAEPVGERIARLGNPPWHVVARRVVPLRPHRAGARSVEQRAEIAAHDKQRHEIFEHRAAPGNECRGAVDRCQHPPELEPMDRLHVALGDGDETAEAGFGGEEIVEGRVEPARPIAIGESEADREDPPVAIEEEAEVHVLHELLGAIGELQQAVSEVCRVRCCGAVAPRRRGAIARRRRERLGLQCLDERHAPRARFPFERDRRIRQRGCVDTDLESSGAAGRLRQAHLRSRIR